MMGEVILSICARGNQVWPREHYFGGPVVDAAITKQPIVHAVMHQDQQGMLAGTDERHGEYVYEGTPEKTAIMHCRENQDPFGKDVHCAAKGAQARQFEQLL